MAKMGQKNGRLAVAVEELFLKPEDREEELQESKVPIIEEEKAPPS